MPAAAKKMLILAILEILRKHTDVEHGLLQSDILERLRAEYGLSATRKTVRQNLTDLQEAGYPIEYRNGWYYEHEFCNAELDLLINSLLFNTNAPYRQCRAVMDKLVALGGDYYKPDLGRGTQRPENGEFFTTLEVLSEAIEAGRQVAFQYCYFDVDKQLHPRMDESKPNLPKEYVVNPYKVAIHNGRHYLICNVDKYDNAAHFRLDRMRNIHANGKPSKPIREVRGLEHGLNVPVYLSEHAYMFAGKPELVRIRAKRFMVGDILDWFGMDVELQNATDDSVEAVFRTDPTSLGFWLKQYGEYVEKL